MAPHVPLGTARVESQMMISVASFLNIPCQERKDRFLRGGFGGSGDFLDGVDGGDAG